MLALKLKGKSGTCQILIGERISNLLEYIVAEESAIITDSIVRKLHGKNIPGKIPIIEIGQGESAKTLSTAERVYDALLEYGLERSSTIVGVGGGVVCDVAGFVASTYLRGVTLGLVPTTLLAQADASIGGKNGLNFKGYKNIIGTIRQPSFVLCDFEALKTLSSQAISCGFAEIIKHASIADKTLFDFLEKNSKDCLSLKKSSIERALQASILIKSRIVEADETEVKERMKLNFGHTIGHAIEKVYGLPHGYCVSIGMAIESKLSVKKNLLKRSQAERLANLLSTFNLPITIDINKQEILDAIEKDKKRRANTIRIPLLEDIGSARIIEIKESDLEAVLDDS
ncbi:MAG: 3-dehydroquinate synthase [Candidatus Anstonellales archaeon]